jgi:hypothetical protein
MLTGWFNGNRQGRRSYQNHGSAGVPAGQILGLANRFPGERFRLLITN